MAAYDDDLYMNPGELVGLLAKAERTQTWLANKLGIAPQSVNHWVNEVRPIPRKHWGRIRRLLRRQVRASKTPE